jgi:hypothetical protein
MVLREISGASLPITAGSANSLISLKVMPQAALI